jgi:hypothetical protein
MANQEDVRTIALSLPETTEDEGHFAFSVNNRGKQKGFVWVWMERVHPKKARIPNLEVVAIRVTGTQEKEMLLATEPELFFTEPHYNGFPAILVRLAAIEVDDLRELIISAWRCQAPSALVKNFDSTSRL